MQQEFDLPQGLELALYWAGRGCRVHPVRYIPATDTHKAQKKPILPTWQKLATVDEVKIRRWWGKWPDAWVGMATGAPGFDVVDFDVADGAPGKQSFDRLIEAGLIDGYLFDVDTPSGGWHRAFPGTAQRNGQIEDAGVDFRATGGFVMAPGNPGYVITAIPAGPELAEPVDWPAIRALLRPDRAPTRPSAPTPNGRAQIPPDIPAAPVQRKSNLRSPKQDQSWTQQQAMAEIVRQCQQLATAKVGSINHTLNNVAMRIGHFVPEFIEYHQAGLQMLRALDMTEYDGKTWQADDTIRSGLDAGMREPYERRPDEPKRQPPPDQPPPAVAGGAPPQVEGRKPIVQKASEIAPRRVRWLWDGRIPAGEITLVAGREGAGKSTLLAWLTRAITQGELPGEYHGHPRAVLYAAAEDSWEHTLAPRMMAAGANLDLVYRVAVTTGGVEGNLVLPLDITAVFELGQQLGAVALMLDPGLSFLDGRIDSFKSQELRPALEALRRGAERAGMSVPMLCHFNKTQGTDVLSKIAGSRAFAEVARAAIAVAVEQPDEEGDEEQVILSQVKNNLGRTSLPNLTYQIVDSVVPTDEGDAHVGRLVWTGQTDRTAEQTLNGILAKEHRENSGVRTRAELPPDEVVEWVISQGRTCSVEEIHEAFPQISRPTLRKRLSRNADDGTRIYRPTPGHYAPKAQPVPIPQGHNQGDSVTSVPPGDAPETSLMAQDVPQDSETGDHMPFVSPVCPVPVVTPGAPVSSVVLSRGGEEDKKDRTDRLQGARARGVTLRPPHDPTDQSGWEVPGDRLIR